MNEKQILEFCLKNKISFEQYFMIYLTKRRWEGYREEFLKYVGENGWDDLQLKDLVARGFLQATSSVIGPESVRLTDKFGEEIFLNTDMGEEFYAAYPATFPLSSGGMFVARRGMPKDQLIKLYLEKISRDPDKHVHVMKQLDTYIQLVNKNKINGHKISDWVTDEIWDTIPEMPDNVSKSNFKEDI